MLVFKTSAVSARPGLQTLKRDPLLSDDKGGVRFVFDAGFAFSYAGGAPANGSVVRDVAEVADGEFVLAAGQSVGFKGNGFDFSTLTATGPVDADNYVNGGAKGWDGIFEKQEFLVCVYMRLPTEADWLAASIIPFFSSSDIGYASEPDPVLGCFTALKRFEFRRQTGINAQSPVTVTPNADHYGQVCQVAFWRNAAGIGARVRGALSTKLTTAAAGALNTANFSACRPKFGCPPPFTNGSTSGATTTRNFRLYRGFLENLSLSGRDPIEVLDADHARTIARSIFS